MRRLPNLWRSLERIPGLLAVPAVWRQQCGEDYAFIHPHLRPTDMVGSAYPCPNNFGECPRRIVDYGDDEFTAICRDPHYSCDTVPLAPREALLHDLDLNTFLQPVLRAAAIRPEHLRDRLPGVWTAGLSERPATRNQPVFVIISPTGTAFEAAVRRLLLEVAGAFVVLAPTNRHRTTVLQEQFQQRSIGYLCLEDQMGVGDDGHYVCASAGEAATDKTEAAMDGPVDRSVGSPEAVAAVRQYIKAKAMTLTTFGNQFGTTDRTIRRFLREGKMRRANFEAMANAIGVTPDQLLRGELPVTNRLQTRR